MNKVKGIQDPKGDKIFLGILNMFLALCFVVVLYPLIYVVSASFSSPQAVISGKVWLWPVDPTLMGYEAVFKNKQIINGFANSFFYMIVGTIVSLIVTLLAAYPLSRKEFKGRNVISVIFIFAMLFSGGLIPTYLLVKNLRLLDTRWALIIPSAMSIWNVIIARTYMQSSIPDELYESAQLDGCGDIRFFISIVMPLSVPVIAVLALYYGVGKWNTYYEAMIYLKDQKLYPLQIILRNILILSNTDPTMVKDFDALVRKQGLIDLVKYSVIVVASVPVLLIYPFVQKYFLKGVMVGALKG